jgi:hypothetical protein
MTGNGNFPAGWGDPWYGNGLPYGHYSWAALILPYIEGNNQYKALDFTKPAYITSMYEDRGGGGAPVQRGPAGTVSNKIVADLVPKTFICPSARRATNEGGIFNKDYGINGGTNSTCCPERTQANQDGVGFVNSRIKLTDIKDGDSNTFLFMELVNWTNHSWIPYDYGSNMFIWVHHPSQGYVCYDGYPPNPPVVNGADFNNRAPASDHSGGLNAVRADGSLMWVPNGIPQTTVYRAMFTRNSGEVIPAF